VLELKFYFNNLCNKGLHYASTCTIKHIFHDAKFEISHNLEQSSILFINYFFFFLSHHISSIVFIFFKYLIKKFLTEQL